ncbi:MAG: VOC family protein [Gemmatimonadetes bacterium]|nr:VOC family protein [Gemmatimonadota bacterium]
MQLTYAIIYVTEMARSVAFYRDALGLPVAFESAEWSEFATEGARLALHLAAAAERGRASDAPMRAGRCVPGFRVADLTALHARLTAGGARCLRAPELVFGRRIAHYADPDGAVVAVSEG